MAATCAGCGQLAESGVLVQGKTYHPDCFKVLILDGRAWTELLLSSIRACLTVIKQPSNGRQKRQPARV